MRLRKDPGWVVSAAAHAALLAVVLLGFSHASQVDDPHEAIPVELVEGRELDQVMKGERTAQAVRPRQRAEKRADLVEPKPIPALAEATKDVAPPPPPVKDRSDPGHDAPKDVPKLEQKSAATLPPARPAEPFRPEPEPQPVKKPAAASVVPATMKLAQAEDAEPVERKPKSAQNSEAKPKEAQKIEPKPEPHKETNPLAAPKKSEPRLEPDRLARLLEQEKQKELVEKPAEKSTPKPRSANETTQPEKRFDPADISKFLSKDAPQRKASASQELQQLASLGAPTASAAKMSPSLWGQLDGLLQEQYKRCWTFMGLGGQKKYVPEIRVQYAEDGSLTHPPELLNPPADPNLRALADSALRAVRRCDPLRIPARYQPYYEQWKGRIVRFDPEEML